MVRLTPPLLPNSRIATRAHQTHISEPHLKFNGKRKSMKLLGVNLIDWQINLRGFPGRSGHRGIMEFVGNDFMVRGHLISSKWGGVDKGRPVKKKSFRSSVWNPQVWKRQFGYHTICRDNWQMHRPVLANRGAQETSDQEIDGDEVLSGAENAWHWWRFSSSSHPMKRGFSHALQCRTLRFKMLPPEQNPKSISLAGPMRLKRALRRCWEIV